MSFSFKSSNELVIFIVGGGGGTKAIAAGLSCVLKFFHASLIGVAAACTNTATEQRPTRQASFCPGGNLLSLRFGFFPGGLGEDDFADCGLAVGDGALAGVAGA